MIRALLLPALHQQTSTLRPPITSYLGILLPTNGEHLARRSIRPARRLRELDGHMGSHPAMIPSHYTEAMSTFDRSHGHREFSPEPCLRPIDLNENTVNVQLHHMIQAVSL
jgi:hypothetical protein